MISTNVVTALGLTPRGKIPLKGIGPSLTYHNGYEFYVAFTLPIVGPLAQTIKAPPGQTPVMVHVFPVLLYGGELAPGNFDVLLGMDVLSSGSLKVEGSGHYSFSF
jgi:hypothetical protein